MSHKGFKTVMRRVHGSGDRAPGGSLKAALARFEHRAKVLEVPPMPTRTAVGRAVETFLKKERAR